MKWSNVNTPQIIATSLPEVTQVLRSKHLASVMVFTAVTDNGRVKPPLFAPPGLRIGTIEYLAIMEEVLVPGLGHHSNLNDMAPVRDSEPGRTARQGENLRKRRTPKLVPKGVWPPSCPGFSSSD